jgi:aminoglycoside phosphotransferase (APT) family kinase protein
MNNQSPEGIVLQRWPVDHFGSVTSSRPITMGLSGAHVIAVVTEKGEFILRVSASTSHDAVRSLRLLRLVSDHDIAPPLLWTSDDGRATVSVKIPGSLMDTRSDVEARKRAMESIADMLRRLHALPVDDVEPTDPVAAARTVWRAFSARADVPQWILSLADAFDDCEARLASDRRRVLSHNDVNPGNVLWDGQRAWLADWDAAGANHPYYDLATLAMFHAMPDDSANALLSRQEGAVLTENDLAMFSALRTVSGILAGTTSLQSVSNLAALGITTVSEAPTHQQFGKMFAAGKIDLRTESGRGIFGAALLRTAYERRVSNE